jgi:predicted Holliday junction resolvase-like endonuclease|tara:strand:- start:746 stop:1183 length:438 start_codon:yes stop_codon:yes gene_type:complete
MDFLTITTIIILLIFGILIGYYLGLKIGILKRDIHWESQIPLHRKDAISKSRSVLSGMFSEQLAPYFPDFNFKPTECRFLGKPIDFIVFKGLDEKDVEEIVFVEVKSGKSKLNKTEKSLKDAIKDKKVSWEEYRIPDDVVKGKED